MQITRKGYYTITGPDGDTLLRRNGALRQATTRDDCYEYILQDGRSGLFTIHAPERTVRVVGSVADQGGSDTEPPTVPTGLVATAANKNQIDLSWQASTDNVGVSGYQVFRDGLPIDTVTAPTVVYSDTSVLPSTSYTYTVAAFDVAGNTSDQSGSDVATTPANAAPSWTQIPDQDLIVGDSFSLDLDDFADDLDVDPLSYTIEAGSLPTGLSLAGSVLSGTPTVAGESSSLTIRADDGNTTTDVVFAIATYNADVTAPPTPTGLAGLPGSNQAQLSWNASVDVQGATNEFVSGTAAYRLYRDGSPIVTQPGITYIDTGLSGGVPVSYTVTAIDTEGNESSQSSSIAVTPSSDSFAEADWQDRISQPGVVWYHDFRNEAEIEQFRWTSAYGGGNDPAGAGQLSFEAATSMHRQASDGVTGGACLELVRPAGSDESNTGWWRQFDPLTGASNGRGIDDPAAGGSIPLKTFTPTDGGSQTANWSSGYYEHDSTESPTQTDGNDFYLQFRVKMDPRRTSGGNQSFTVGKLLFLTTTKQSLTGQEIVTYSNGGVGGSATNYHRIYTAGSPPLEQQDSRGRPGQQLGSDTADYSAGVYCDVGSQQGNCWAYSGGWDTLLYHVIAGREGTEETRLQVWGANPGDTDYTKLWDVVYDVSFQENGRAGWNALIASTFNNGASLPQEFWHRYDQFILSRDWIRCPGSQAPAWFESQADQSWSAPVSNTAADVGAPGAVFTAWTGGSVSEPRGELILAANGGHFDYSGNEVYACQLRRDTPRWVRLTDKSTNTGGTDTTNGDAAYPDGNPRSVHGWAHAYFAEGRHWYLGMAGMFPNGNQSTAVWSWDREYVGNDIPAPNTDAGWTYHGLGLPGVSGWGSNIDYQSGSTAYDKNTKTLWHHCNFTVAGNGTAFFSVDALTGEITNYPGSSDQFAQGNFLSDAISVIVDSVWIILARNTNRIYLLDLTNPEGGMTFRTSTGSPSWFPSGAGGVYHAASNAILVYDESFGQTIRKLTVPSDPFTGSWIWSAVSGTGVTPTGQAGDFQGLYSKFNLIEDMGNGQGALVAALSNSNSPFVYKLPAVGV